MGKVGALKRGMERRHVSREERRRGTLWFIALCMFSLGAVVLATSGDDFLNEKERQLATVVAAVQNNDAQKCDLLKTCTVTTCSRNTCLPEEGDVNKYTCMPVTFNKYCNASVPGCRSKYFDYTRSSVRTAVNTDFNGVLTTIGTCAQRALDPVFQTVSTPASLLRLYFGAIDGSWRGFPGSDQNVNDPECGGVKYDTRLRPWYRISTSVPKVVTILIDIGQSMNLPILQGQGSGSVLDNAKSIVGEFLKALSDGDFVNIIMFGSKATPLSPTMVPVIVNTTTSLPELDPLWQSLSNQTSENQPGTSDVTLGIDLALQTFPTNYSDAAKTILVFTDGNFATTSNISNPVYSTLASSNAKVFVYKIPPLNDGNLFVKNTPFANQICSIGGSFEVISSSLSNPILAMNNFFTYTASLHAAVTNNSADYSSIYAGYEQIEGNITTVSISVFSTNMTLVGVMGMDIFISSLGILTEPVQTAIATRSVSKAFKSSSFLLTSANCSLQNVTSPEPCPGVPILLGNGGFCNRTDQSSTIEDLACCGSCAKSDNSKKKTSTGVIAGSTVGAFILVASALGCLLFWVCKRRKRTLRKAEPKEYPEFKGSDGELAEPDGAEINGQKRFQAQRHV